MCLTPSLSCIGDSAPASRLSRSALLWMTIASVLALSQPQRALAAPALNQQATRVAQERAFPKRLDFYEPDEPDRDLKLWAEQTLGLYLVDPPRRHASERVDYSSDHLHFHLWRPIGQRSMVELWSEAASWLVFGRIKYSNGARGLYGDLGSLKRVTVSLHEVIRPKQEGRRLSKEPDLVEIYLTISLTRESFERLDLDALRSCSLNANCDRKMRSAFSLVKLNSRYIKRRRRQ